MRRNLIDLVDEMEPAVRRAFLQSIADMRRDFDLQAFLIAYEAGDVEAALVALQVVSEYFAPLDNALRVAYQQGGAWAFQQIQRASVRAGVRIVGAFATGHPRAEAFLQASSATRVVEITQGQREGLREVLRQSMASGINAERAALEIAGRTDGRGVRNGGLIGLTEAQMQYVRNARAELGDPARMANWFTRELRDRRSDKTIRGYLERGEALPQKAIDRLVDRYQGRMLRERGRSIARTELLRSMHAAQHEGIQQMIDRGRFRPQDVTLTWDAAEDGFTRPTHNTADDQVIKFGETFTVGGFQMRFPGDTSLGAPAREVIRCRCRLHVSIDFIAAALARKLAV